MNSRNFSIQKRLTLSYMILIIMVIVLICFALFIVFFTSMIETSQEQIGLQLENLSMSIVSQLESIVHIGNNITEDTYIMDILNRLENTELSEYLYENYTEQSISPLISRLILVNRNLRLLDPINNRFVYQDAIIMSPDFVDFLTSGSQILLSKPGIFPIDIPGEENESDLTVVLYQKIYNDSDLLAGYLLSVLDKEYLLSTVWQYTVGNDFSGIALFDQRNECVHYVGRKFAADDIQMDFGKSAWRSSFWTIIDRKRFNVFLEPVSGFNWTIAAIVPYSTIFKQLILAFMLIIIIGIFFILGSFFISTLIARNITHPLLEVTRAMHRYDDSQNLEQIDVKANGELEYLVKIYNKMVRSVNDSICNMLEEHEKKNQAELMSLQYELDFLQAQINPHFIHNTLNAIGYKAQEYGQQELYQSLQAFNTLLRASISGSREMIPLREELALVESFENIQRLRYGESFIVSGSIEESYMNIAVPKLILQPVVENAIFYGEETDGVTRISITVAVVHGEFIIKVTDNGPGMDIKLIEDVQKDNRRKFNRIGLKNVDERVKILFGDEYGLSIESAPGKGTTVTISMPGALC